MSSLEAPELAETIEARIWDDVSAALVPRGAIAFDVSEDDYMEYYAQHFCEYVEGVVIKMSPVQDVHDMLTYFIRTLFEAYFELRPVGKVRAQPFVMRLPAFPKRRREPDILVVLNTNPHELLPTYMNGPADLVVEVVSDESIERDYGEKFKEYEKGGVGEYWLLDPVRQQTLFYVLNRETGHYVLQKVSDDGYYHTSTLPGLKLHIPTLWQERLPGPLATAILVQAMLGDTSE